MKLEKWVIRKRWSFMWGSPGYYWRVSHSSLPAYVKYCYHFDSFENAVEYADAKARALAAS